MNITIVDQRVFISSPDRGAAVHAASYYTGRDDACLVSYHSYLTRSDTVDVAFLRRSMDNGRTWTDAVPIPTRFEHPAGVGRRHLRGGYVDPGTDRYVVLWTEGVLPTDHPGEGMRRWTLHYSVSADGGRTECVREQIIHEGPGYDAVHHLPGVTVGRNCVMMGDLGQRPLTRADGVILVPVQSSPVGADGDYANLGGGMTYTDCLLLMGRWRADGRLFWIGNICARNPKGNSPRFPRLLCQVDRAGGCLLRDRVAVIDDRQPDESPHLTLSNFYAREDRETGELLLHLSRTFAHDFRESGAPDWTADALLYRIRVR